MESSTLNLCGSCLYVRRLRAENQGPKLKNSSHTVPFVSLGCHFCCYCESTGSTICFWLHTQEEAHSAHARDLQVLMPKYDCLRYDLISNVTEIASFNYAGSHIRVFRGQVEGLNTTFLEPDNGMFWVGCVYGRNDDAHRFNFFCGAALEYLKHHAPHKTDVVHCHDWPTAPVAFGDVGGSKYAACHHCFHWNTKLSAEVGFTRACCMHHQQQLVPMPVMFL